MKFRLQSGLAAIACLSLASCYVVKDNPTNKKAENKTDKMTASPDQVKLTKEDETNKKNSEQETKKTENPDTTAEKTENSTTPSESPKPSEPKTNDFAFANKVPGKEGFVFSPYNNKVVDVRDIPSGTLVQDPTYPASEKKYFRVP